MEIKGDIGQEIMELIKELGVEINWMKNKIKELEEKNAKYELTYPSLD